MQAAEFVVATPSSACHVSLVHPAPLEGQKPHRSVWGAEYPYQSVNTSQPASDPGENFRVVPMLHPVLMLAYTSPSSLLLVSSLLLHNYWLAGSHCAQSQAHASSASEHASQTVL